MVYRLHLTLCDASAARGYWVQNKNKYRLMGCAQRLDWPFIAMLSLRFIFIDKLRSAASFLLLVWFFLRFLFFFFLLDFRASPFNFHSAQNPDFDLSSPEWLFFSFLFFFVILKVLLVFFFFFAFLSVFAFRLLFCRISLPSSLSLSVLLRPIAQPEIHPVLTAFSNSCFFFCSFVAWILALLPFARWQPKRLSMVSLVRRTLPAPVATRPAN